MQLLNDFADSFWWFCGCQWNWFTRFQVFYLPLLFGIWCLFEFRSHTLTLVTAVLSVHLSTMFRNNSALKSVQMWNAVLESLNGLLEFSCHILEFSENSVMNLDSHLNYTIVSLLIDCVIVN